MENEMRDCTFLYIMRKPGLQVDTTPGQDDNESDSGLSTPETPDADINFDYVYALYRFEATLEGQVTVQRDQPLYLLDDSNSYWWLVRPIDNEQYGYIPAENIETPFERLARLNRHLNVKNLLPDAEDQLNAKKYKSTRPSNFMRNVKFMQELTHVVEFEVVSEYGSGEDEYEEGEGDAQEDEAHKRARFEEEHEDASMNDQEAAAVMEDFFDEYANDMSPYVDRFSYSDFEEGLLSPAAAEHPSAVVLRVYTGKMPVLEPSYKNVVVTDKTTAYAMARQALRRFKIDSKDRDVYYLTVLTPGSEEYRLGNDDYPIAVLELIQSGRNSMVSNASARSSTSSLNMIMQSMGVSGENVVDHTNHDHVFRFYLHKEGSQQETEQHVQSTVYIKVIAIVQEDAQDTQRQRPGNNAKERKRRLAIDPRDGRDVLEYIPVDVRMPFSQLPPLACSEMRIDHPTEEMEFLVIVNGEERIPDAREPVANYALKTQEDDIYFVLRAKVDATTQQRIIDEMQAAPSLESMSSPEEVHQQSDKKGKRNTGRYDASPTERYRKSLQHSQLPPNALQDVRVPSIQVGDSTYLYSILTLV
jgi:hypothetical protein